MFKQEYFGLQLWVWLVIISIGMYFISKSCNYQEKFDNKNSKVKIYNFNTSWCGWSKKFQPIWDSFAKKDLENRIDVKCDDDTHKQFYSQFKINGFPSVIAVVDGKHIPYNGSRTQDGLDDFMDKLNNNTYEDMSNPTNVVSSKCG